MIWYLLGVSMGIGAGIAIGRYLERRRIVARVYSDEVEP